MSDTTNDEQVKTATAPLMSEEELTAITKRYPEVNGDTSTAYDAGDEIRDWYEAKIAGGELMVRKVGPVYDVARDEWHLQCLVDSDDANFKATGPHGMPGVCPGCGAKIIEA